MVSGDFCEHDWPGSGCPECREERQRRMSHRDPDFSYETPDSLGRTPDFRLVGRRLRHLGNQKIYTIRGFAWMGERDVWGFTHDSEDEVLCCRPLDHLDGVRSDGQPRYMMLEE